MASTDLDDSEFDRFMAEVEEDLRQKVPIGSIAEVMALIDSADLSGLTSGVPERAVDDRISSILAARFGRAYARFPIGMDGEVREFDFLLELRASADAQAARIAIEYKLYRRCDVTGPGGKKKRSGGELDRGLGQSITYARSCDAALLVIVFMDEPKSEVPPDWFKRSEPFWLERHGQRVPLYTMARPRDWSAEWAKKASRLWGN